MTPRGPECSNVDQFLEASRHAERWLSQIETIAVFCKEGQSDYARDGVMALRDEHRRFAEVLHAWRETLTSVATEKIRVAAQWFPSAHSAAIGMAEKFILRLEAAFRLSEILHGNGGAVSGELDYSRFGSNGSWPKIRACAIDFWEEYFLEDDLSRITTPLECERAAIDRTWRPTWSPLFTRKQWLAIFAKAGLPMSEDTFDRRIKTGEYRKNPQSERNRISLDLSGLPARVQSAIEQD
jgi:hypothetical protein